MQTDTLEQPGAGEFVRPPQVMALAHETFTQAELCEAFGVEKGHIIAAVTRFGMFLVSDKIGPAGRSPRQFHLLDAYALLIYLISTSTSEQPEGKHSSRKYQVCFSATL